LRIFAQVAIELPNQDPLYRDKARFIRSNHPGAHRKETRLNGAAITGEKILGANIT
jgi:hypothetical protein